MPRRSSTRWVATIFAVALTLTGCGSSAGTIGPTGVDELVVPSPDPVAADFTDRISNTWYPLLPGARWQYASPSDTSTLAVTVLDEPGSVIGIATVQVRRELRSADGATTTQTDQVAQDTAGNLWLLGQDSPGDTRGEDWQVGADTGAGLLWPAAPRVGDGWPTTRVPERREVITQVTSDEKSVQTPAGDFTGAVEAVVRDLHDPLGATRVLWARGTGPVQYRLGSGDLLELQSFTPGT